jgi:hypothetical protein
MNLIKVEVKRGARGGPVYYVVCAKCLPFIVQVALQCASFSMVVESPIADNVYEVAICNQPATGQKKTAHRLNGQLR